MKLKFLLSAFFLSSMALFFADCNKENAPTVNTEEFGSVLTASERDNCCFFKFKTSVPIGLDVYTSSGGGTAHNNCSGETMYAAGIGENGYPGPCDGNFKAHFHRSSGSGAFILKIATTSGGMYSINVPATAMGIDVKFEGCALVGYEFCGTH